MELEEALKEIETMKASKEESDKSTLAMQAKMDELLGETKKAKQKAKDEADLLAASEAERALKDGDYKQLLESSEKRYADKEAEYNEYVLNGDKKDISMAALEYALKCNPVNDAAAKDLAVMRFEKNMKMVDGKPRLLDKDGNLTVLSADEYIKGLVASGDIGHFIKGSQASGGGADGNTNNSGAEKVITRAQFGALNPSQQMAFSKDAKAGKAEITD